MPRFSEIISRIAFFVGVFVIVYAIGAATVHFRVFPYPQVLNAMHDLMYEMKFLPWSLFR